MNDVVPSRTELATFAGGCFWCMVKPFDELPGILSVVSGYTGGHTKHPTYEEVGKETTGHAEAVRIVFDPVLFPYERLLELYWQLIDPTDAKGQFYDRGSSYRTAIFYHSEEQRRLAEASKRALRTSGRFKKPIVTEIVAAGTFYPAEDEHQHYYKKNPYEYKLYLEGSGREAFADRHWRSKSDRERLRKRLNPLQFEVTQNRAIEPPYENEYWDNKRDGIYADILSGDPLFGSVDRIDSGTGWPSFLKPLEEGLIRREADFRGGQVRIAVLGRLSGAFLGYYVQDGTEPFPRYYRLNSASLKVRDDRNDGGSGVWTLSLSIRLCRPGTGNRNSLVPIKYRTPSIGQ